MMPPGDIDAVRGVCDVLEELRVFHYVGGSMASSKWGVPRTTLDGDVVADMKADHVDPFVARLGDAYYADADAIRRAITHRSSFNVIYQPAVYKVDVFILKRRPYDQQAAQRIQRGQLADDEPRVFPLAAPEDVVLNKLEWFRDGGEVSERQWLDVLGVLRVQEGHLDEAYMDHWAAELGLSDLLARARRDAADYTIS